MAERDMMKEGAFVRLYKAIMIEDKIEDLKITLKIQDDAIQRSKDQHQMLVNMRAEIKKRIDYLKKKGKELG